MSRRHGRPKKYAQFSLLQAALVEEPRHSGLFIFQNTLHLGNSDPVPKTIPPVLELIITLLPKNPCETRKAKCRCPQCYQGKLRAVCTNPLRLHACSSPRSTPYLLLPCSIRSYPSSLCIFPLVNRERELP